MLFSLLLLGACFELALTSVSTESADAIFYTGNGMRVLYQNNLGGSAATDPILGLVLGLSGGVQSAYTPYYYSSYYPSQSYSPYQYSSSNYNYYSNQNQNGYYYGYQQQQSTQQPYGYANQNYNFPQQCRTVRFVDYVQGRIPRYYCDCPPYGTSYQYYGCKPSAG